MRTIGIRALKAQLSSVIRDVQRGDIFLVTDRGRVVAELKKPASPAAGNSIANRLLELAQSGHLRVAESRSVDYRPSPLTSKRGLAKKLIDQDRGG